jgi:U1 small nuclear ribonucleoprotein C
MLTIGTEIGQEKAQSVIDSITSSYAAEGQAVPNPAMAPPGAFPPPFGFPGTRTLPLLIDNPLLFVLENVLPVSLA